MLHEGTHIIDRVTVEVARKPIRRINLRITGDGLVRLSIPVRGASLRAGEDFLKAKWQWVLKSRAKLLSRPKLAPVAPLTETELVSLQRLLVELNALWAARVGETVSFWRHP